MAELEIEKLEINLAENDSYKEEERSADDTGYDLREELKDILSALEADDEVGNLEGEEGANIEERAEVSEIRQKDKLPALRDVPKQEVIRLNY